MRLLAISTMSPAVLVQVKSQSHNCPGQITIWAFRLTLQPSISPVVIFLVVFGQSSHKSCVVGCANLQLRAFFLLSLKALESPNHKTSRSKKVVSFIENNTCVVVGGANLQRHLSSLQLSSQMETLIINDNLQNTCLTHFFRPEMFSFFTLSTIYLCLLLLAFFSCLCFICFHEMFRYTK